MRNILLTLTLALLLAPAMVAGQARRTAGDSNLRDRIVAFVKRTQLGVNSAEVKQISPPDSSGLRKVSVHLKGDGGREGDTEFYITADGKKILQGEVADLSGSPWRATQQRLAQDVPGAPSEGDSSAPVTLVEFSDLQCPFCKTAYQNIQQVMQQDPGKLHVVFKYYPLPQIHPWAMRAALDAACVAGQGQEKFWTFAQTVFDHQDELNQQQQANDARATSRLRDFALEAGAEALQFDRCVSDPDTRAKVERSIRQGKQVGVTSTPTLYVNGRQINGAIDTPVLKQLVEHEAQVGPEYDRELASGALKGQQCGKCGTLPPLPKK